LTQVHNVLFPIYDWFSEGFDTADLKEAKALLDKLIYGQFERLLRTAKGQFVAFGIWPIHVRYRKKPT